MGKQLFYIQFVFFITVAIIFIQRKALNKRSELKFALIDTQAVNDLKRDSLGADSNNNVEIIPNNSEINLNFRLIMNPGL